MLLWTIRRKKNIMNKKKNKEKRMRKNGYEEFMRKGNTLASGAVGG